MTASRQASKATTTKNDHKNRISDKDKNVLTICVLISVCVYMYRIRNIYSKIHLELDFFFLYMFFFWRYCWWWWWWWCGGYAVIFKRRKQEKKAIRRERKVMLLSFSFSQLLNKYLTEISWHSFFSFFSILFSFFFYCLAFSFLVLFEIVFENK